MRQRHSDTGMLRNIIFAAVVIAIFFALLETISRVLVFPGSHSFIERRIIEEGLSQKKKAGEFRIFLFGESTMQGHYLYPYSTVDIWMRMYLEDLLPADEYRRVDIVNFGRIGSTSEFIASSFMGMLRYRPDLAVFYAAHNDFCLFGNRRELLARKTFREWTTDAGRWLVRHSSFLNAINRISIRAKFKNRTSKAFADRKLDGWYPEDDKELVIPESDLLSVGSPKFNILRDNFEKNINRIAAASKRYSVPVIFLEAVSKWKGYEPVRSFHSAGIPKDRLSDWDAAYSAAEKAFAEKDYVSALGLYARCVEIDPDYALAHYRMGQCYESLGDPQKANGSYAAANDLDRYLIRAPSTVNRFYDSLAASAPGRVFVIKTRELFERSSPAGVIGDELIGDQIHPTIDGQALMALEIVRTIYGSGLLAPKLRWRWDRLRSVGEMKRSLKVDAHAEVEMELALAGYVQRDYPKAAQFLEKAYALRPDSVFISSWLAWVYWKLGDRDKSIALYRRLAHDAPALSSAFFSRHPDIRSAL